MDDIVNVFFLIGGGDLIFCSQVFRETSGQALVWGDKPQKITAHYTTGDGSSKTSLLLASGSFLC
jgi:hypothetical protein